MSFRRLLAVTALALTTLTLGAPPASAGIIVTVGLPSPDLFRPAPRHDGTRPTCEAPGDLAPTRCFALPGAFTLCARSLTVESSQALPTDWVCIPLDETTFWCEVPGGDALVDEAIEEFVAEAAPEADLAAPEEVAALGCSGGDPLGLGGLGIGLGLLVARRRRQAA